MTARIRPSRATGEMQSPPSKSMAHRLLVCAGLSPGVSVVRGVSDSDDMHATIDCLRALGAAVEKCGDTVTVQGMAAVKPRSPLPCRACGSTLRFFVPIALLGDQPVTLTGTQTLFSRPLHVYETICRMQGLTFAQKAQSLTVCGKLRPGRFAVPGNISSQFISGLLFALPLLEADSAIELIPPVESAPYIRMTLQSLETFGVRAQMHGNTIAVPGRQTFRPQDATVEGDWSNAAFFDALNLIGGDVRVTGLRDDSLQGDKVCRAYFAALSAGTPTLDLTDCPDLGPVCMALAAAKHGARFTGTRRLRIKESDRVACMCAELAKFGVRCDVGEDTVQIRPAGLHAPDVPLCGHDDHRIVMALSVLLTQTGGTIKGAEAVSKSLPDFFDRLQNLGIEVRTDGMDS